MGLRSVTSRAPPVLQVSHVTPRDPGKPGDLPRDWSSAQPRDITRFRHATRLLIGMWKTVVTVDESIREEDGSDDEEKDEDVKDVICQLLDQRTASQRRDKSCAPSH